MSDKKNTLLCVHCKKNKARKRHRSLCDPCYRTPCVRAKYPIKRDMSCDKFKPKEPVADVYKRLLEMWKANPLWQPSPYPRDDPRYNELVAARRAAKLPEIHPNDPKPNLE